MNQQSFSAKIARDMFGIQMKWSLWFLLFVLIAHIAMLIISAKTGNRVGDFLFFSHGSAKIYMLVIGILSTYAFMTFFIHNGLTRKDYFKGSALAAAGIAFAMTLIAAVLSLIEYLVLGVTHLPVSLNRSLTEIGIQVSGNSISAFLPKAIIGSSILVHSDSFMGTLFMYILNTLTYYVVGWLIGAGFYRFGWLIGLGFVAMSIVLVTIGDLLWGTKLGEPLSHWLAFDSLDLPLYGSLVGTIALIALMLWLIRLLTRDVMIKM
ncbi:MAG TPA: hypothetical protein VK097_14575 [Lentibacillus sp.]|uniref:hypothetical protein n=1 Tax=Lentibacillus sp. TaxID=1925746 RepID=UPI002B4B7B94|nr:hypothetical protein [Lentibacillus sp.]HLR63634.1 hypothetical protein [Lentibacillus sp.]